jgi:uncharacterized protein
MDIYLPVAAMDANIMSLGAIGVGVGFVQGLLGSGGFLLTPLLILLGVSPTIAAASGVLPIAGASVSGTAAHLRAGNVDMKMGTLLLIGGVSGGVGGTFLARFLRLLGNLNLVIICCFVAFMLIIFVTVFVEALTSGVQGKAEGAGDSSIRRFFQRLPLQSRFEVSGVETSLLAPALLGFIVGMLAAIMGVGGGFFLVPAMTYFLGMPMRVVVGTSLFQMLFTTSSVTLMQAAVNHTVDVLLGAILLIGSTVGAQLGAWTVQRLKADQLKLVFSMMVLGMALKMLNSLLSTPGFFLVELAARR